MRLVPAFFVVSSALVLAFILMPILRMPTFDKIFFVQLKNLAEAKDYFNIISNIVSSLATVAGIYLGYVYFYLKNDIDRKNKLLEKKCNEYSYIIGLIKEYESIFRKYIDTSRKSLVCDHFLSDFKICYSQIYDILEANTVFFGLTDSELSIFLELHSYVEGLFVAENSSADQNELEEIIEIFRGKIFSVKQLCWAKSHEVG